MPDYFTHGVAAEIIYEKLEGNYRKLITDKTLYMLGAQGGDVFFAYNIKPTKTNLGRSLHGENAVSLFNALARGNPSYAAGFATHYALDSALHPYIYEYESGKRSPFAHVRFESDLGLYVSRKYGLRRQILPKEKVLAAAFGVYDSIKRVQPLVTVTGVERCLKRHFSYTKFLYRTKRQDYRCDYDFNRLSKCVEDGMDFGTDCVKCALEKRIDPDIFGREFLQKFK